MASNDGWLEADKDVWTEAPETVATAVQPPPVDQDAPKTKDLGPLNAIIAKTAQGFFKGGADEGSGAMTGFLARNFHGGDAKGHYWKQPDGSMKRLDTDQDVYRAGRDAQRYDQDSADEHHGKLGTGMEILGDIGSDAILRGLGAPVLTSGYQTAVGALSALLNSKAELTSEKTSPKEMAQAGAETGAGALLSFYAPKVGGKLANQYKGSALDKLLKSPTGLAKKVMDAPSDILKSIAETRAVKAAGPMLRDVRAMLSKDNLHEIGRDLLDNKVVKFGSGLEGIAKRASDIQSLEGRKIGDFLSAVDDRAGREFSTEAPRVDVDVLGDRIERELIDPLRDKPVYDSIVKDLSGEVKGIRNRSTDELSNQMTFKEANDLKRSYDPFLDFDQPQTPLKEQHKRLRGIINSEIEDRAKSIAPDLFGKYKESKRLFGNMSKVTGMSEDKLARTEANRFLSPSDHALGIAAALESKGGVAQDSLTGLGIGLGNKLFRERGNGALAVTADALSGLLKVSPDALGRYGPVLLRELERYGAEGMAAMDLALTKDNPEYAKLRASLGGALSAK